MHIYLCTYIHIQAHSQSKEAIDQLDIVDMEIQSIKIWHICIYIYIYIYTHTGVFAIQGSQ